MEDGYEKASWEVKAYEQLTVPAGTFDCFRVDGVLWGNQTRPPLVPAREHYEVTYWYCPAVKWIARKTTHGSLDADYSPSQDDESVLTSYKVSE
jgi:hypothetical protein